MGTVPTPPTQTAGLVVPAATINGQGNLATWLAGRVESGGSRRPLCVLRQTVTQTLTNAIDTPITFDTEDVDYDNGHSTVTNTSRYTANTAGWYHLDYGVAFATNATSDRVVQLRLNGAGSLAASRVQVMSNAGGGSPTVIAGSRLMFLNAADYVEVLGTQSSGGNLNTIATGSAASWFTISWQSV